MIVSYTEAHKLAINIRRLINGFKTVKEQHRDSCELRMSITTIPGLNTETKHPCGTPACHAGWAFLALNAIKAHELIAPELLAADRTGYLAWKLVASDACLKEDEYCRNLYEALQLVPRTQEWVMDFDFNLGCEYLSAHLGFESERKMLDFFSTHSYLWGNTGANGMFTANPFWEVAWFESYCRKHDVDTDSPSIDVLIAWWSCVAERVVNYNKLSARNKRVISLLSTQLGSSTLLTEFLMKPTEATEDFLNKLENELGKTIVTAIQSYLDN